MFKQPYQRILQLFMDLQVAKISCLNVTIITLILNSFMLFLNMISGITFVSKHLSQQSPPPPCMYIFYLHLHITIPSSLVITVSTRLCHHFEYSLTLLGGVGVESTPNFLKRKKLNKISSKYSCRYFLNSSMSPENQ